MKTTILLVRHGKSETNLTNVFSGHTNPKLTPEGIAQGEKTAEYIKANYFVDRICSSDLDRAYRTAVCLSSRLGKEIETDEALREIYAGAWEELTFEEIERRYPEEYYTWHHRMSQVRCPEGESIREMSERSFAALERIAKENEGETVAVFSHATVIRAALCLVRTGGLEQMDETPWPTNASVSVFQYENGVWTLVLAAEDRHLKA